MSFPAEQEDLDALLVSVLQNHREKVVGWLRDEPGSWGFLAGQGVRACREAAGRSLTDAERRRVWSRLWQLLTQLKAQIVE